MATKSIAGSPAADQYLKSKRVREFASIALAKIAESSMDTIITVFVTAITLIAMYRLVHPYYLTFVPGMFITAMVIQLLIRVVHDWDDSYTTDELADLILTLNEKVSKIERNV